MPNSPRYALPRYGNNAAREAIIFELSRIAPVLFTHLSFEHILTIMDYYPSHAPAWYQKSVKKREQDMTKYLLSDFILQITVKVTSLLIRDNFVPQ